MYIGEQLIDPTPERLQLSAQLGVQSVVLDNRGSDMLSTPDGRWDAASLTDYRKMVERFGLKLEVFALDVKSILLDFLVEPQDAERQLDVLRHNIAVAGDAGIGCLKYNVQMVGITRTGLRPGRGGCEYSSFSYKEYSPEADKAFSYWGVGYPSNQEDGDSQSELLCGQKMARQVPSVSQADGWRAIEFVVDGLLPAAEQAGVKLACHPHDPAYPVDGLNGVHHVMGSLDGIERFLALSDSKYHGLNFCQGTVAEMSVNPHDTVMEAIERFGERIFMVHFRNIRGGYLDFSEVFPDEGDVDMYQALKAYDRAGYAGILCPDHVPISTLDPNRERFMSFALGYTRGLLQALATSKKQDKAEYQAC